jgi:hypothetical protein
MALRSPVPSIVLALSLALSPLACGSGGGPDGERALAGRGARAGNPAPGPGNPAPGGGIPAPSAPNRPPAASFQAAPSGILSGDIAVDIRLEDADHDPLAIGVEHALGGGALWSPCTAAPGSAPLVGLAASPGGVLHRFVWRSLADTGAALASGVRLRVRVSDPVQAGTGDVTVAGFTVDNRAPAAPPVGPSITSLDPDRACRTASLRIRGSGFDPVATANDVRVGPLAATVVLSTPTLIVAEVPGAAPLGASPVTVAVGGIASAPALFEVLPYPTLASIAPAAAAVGDTITLSGTTWSTRPDGVVVRFAGGVSAIVTSASGTDVTLRVPTGARSGAVTVVTHGASTGALPFTVTTGGGAAPANTPPRIASVTWPAGRWSGLVSAAYDLADAERDVCSIAAEFTSDGGASWRPATADVVAGDPVSGLAASPSGIAYAFEWDSLADLGPVAAAPCRLRFTPHDGRVSGATVATSGTFQVDNTAFAARPPTITNVSPASGTVLGRTLITVTGTRFDPSTVVTVGGRPLDAPVFVGSTTIRGRTPAAAAPGAVAVAASGASGASAPLAAGYLYVDESQASIRIASVDPPSGPNHAPTRVRIRGVGLDSGTEVTIGGARAPNPVAVDATTLDCDTPVVAFTGTVDVEVLNGRGLARRRGGFTFVAASAPPPASTPPPSSGTPPSSGGTPPPSGATPPSTGAPTIASVSPASGPLLGETLVTVAGTGFDAGTVIKVRDQALKDIVLVGPTTIRGRTLRFATPGTYDVSVENARGRAVLPGAFTMLPAAQAPIRVAAVSPDSGPRLTPTRITITGAGFDASSAVFLDGVRAANVVVSSPTTIRCDTPISSRARPVHVDVLNDRGLARLEWGFTYR